MVFSRTVWVEIMSNNSDIMLSVIIPTYNHECYIERALNSVREQKTTYSYEVLVGEDCSTDHTKDILLEYEHNYPGFMTVYYREKNMNSSSLYNSLDLKLKSKGKYMILLEGDDYWTCEYKIQRQIDFLESHPEYVAVAHNCIVVDENGNPIDERYPECKHNEYTIEDFSVNIFPGQSTTLMMKNYYVDPYCDYSIMFKHISPGDQLNNFVLVNAGKIYCIQEVMSAYRHVVKGGTSYSANYHYNFSKREEWNRELLFYAYRINKKDAIRVAAGKYFETILRGLRTHEITCFDFLRLFLYIRNPLSTIIQHLKIRKKTQSSY